MLLDARNTDISPEQARQQLHQFFGSQSNGTIKHVTIWLKDCQKVTYPDDHAGL